MTVMASMIRMKQKVTYLDRKWMVVGFNPKKIRLKSLDRKEGRNHIIEIDIAIFEKHCL